MTGPALRTPAEVERLRARRADPAFAPAWAALRERADTALAQRLRPAPTGAGWGHHYYCPDHAAALAWAADSPHAHRCPVDGRVWRGSDFDAAWICGLNGRILAGLQAAAQVWLATGERRYHDHVAGILADYVRLYPQLPPHGTLQGQGKVEGISLAEAVWAIGVATAYDDARDGFAPADGAAVEALLGDVAAFVRGQLMGKIHNIECWHLSALVTLAAVLDRPGDLAGVLAGRVGLAGQLAAGIRADGWWTEGSPTYHFYMLRAVLPAVRALRRWPERAAEAGVDVGRLKAMFDAPLSMARPDLSLPATNDGWNAIALPGGLARQADQYEEAYGVWPDPGYAAFLATAYRGGAPRNGAQALAMGPDLSAVPDPAPPPPTRRLFPASGYAVLADPPPAVAPPGPGSPAGGRYLLVKYGPHGGGHGHVDKLLLDLWAYGARLAPDPGSPAYNSPLQGPWYRQTLSHNTVVVGERSQPEACGRLLAFTDPATAAGGLGLVDVAVGWPPAGAPAGDGEGSWLKEERRPAVPEYAGVRVRRIVLWAPLPAGYLLDVVLVDGAAGHRVDLAFHHRGVLVDPDPAALAPVAGWAAPDASYAPLTDPRELAAGPGWAARFAVDGAGTAVWGLNPPGAVTLACRAPGNPPADTLAVLLRRARGPRCCFVALLDPHPGERGSVRAVRWSAPGLATPAGTLDVEVEHAAGTDAWRLAVDPAAATSSLFLAGRAGGGASYHGTIAAAPAGSAEPPPPAG